MGIVNFAKEEMMAMSCILANADKDRICPYFSIFGGRNISILCTYLTGDIFQWEHYSFPNLSQKLLEVITSSQTTSEQKNYASTMIQNLKPYQKQLDAELQSCNVCFRVLVYVRDVIDKIFWKYWPFKFSEQTKENHKSNASPSSTDLMKADESAKQDILKTLKRNNELFFSKGGD